MNDLKEVKAIEYMVESVGLEKLKVEQKQELFECIRHFTKYKAFSMLDSSLAVAGEADAVQASLIKLYEEHYESPKTA
jgi:hypothetical protein